ncbi:MAG: hypothetical protein IMW93_10995 [Thermoanaerobacteraceae bacterium]|nr:hypothetical protein [Thermoanaerobacteraceae bacterium]
MEKSSLDPNMLPEPWRSMLQNIDPAAIEQLRASIDPSALLGMLNGAVDFMRQSLNEKDGQAVNELLASLMQLLNQKGNS